MREKICGKGKMWFGWLLPLTLFIWGFMTSVTMSDDPIADTKNLISAHDSSSPQYRKDCTSCHAAILSEKSLDPSVPGVHVAMLPNTPGKGDKRCIWCHRTVDLTPGSTLGDKFGTNLRKGINTTLCSLCHGPFGPAKSFYQAGISPTRPDGAALYDLVCAACHRDLVRSEVRGESFSDIQKAIKANKGGMGPLQVLLSEEIQAIANALAK